MSGNTYTVTLSFAKLKPEDISLARLSDRLSTAISSLVHYPLVAYF